MAAKHPDRFCVRASGYPTKLISINEYGSGQQINITDKRGPIVPIDGHVSKLLRKDQYITIHTSTDGLNITITHTLDVIDYGISRRYAYIKNTSDYLCWLVYSRIVPYPLQKDRLLIQRPGSILEEYPKYTFIEPYNPALYTLAYSVYITRPSFSISPDYVKKFMFVERSFRYFKIILLYHYVKIPSFSVGETLSNVTAPTKLNGKEIDDFAMRDGTSIKKEDLFSSYATMQSYLCHVFVEKLDRLGILSVPKDDMERIINTWYFLE